MLKCIVFTPKYPSRGNVESLAKDNDTELEVQGVGVFLANVPQSTTVKQQDTGPGTTTRQFDFADAQSKRCLVLTSPESVGKRTNTSTSGIYYALPAIHSHQSVSAIISDQLK